MKVKKDYLQIKKNTCIQEINKKTRKWTNWPKAVEEMLTLEQFIKKYNAKRSENTTITEPPIANWIAEIDEDTNFWFSIPFEELYENFEEEYYGKVIE